MPAFDFDYAVVGSGFGGSVAALRLAEKGYRVVVLGKGKRWSSADFPRTNWRLRKYLWAPKLRCFGIQALSWLRDLLVLHGAGVGGGSLVYAGTLLVPADEVFRDPRWAHLADWQRELAPHYATARHMLGVTTAPCPTELDEVLHEVAVDLGRGVAWRPTEVGVYFGPAGQTVPDPYFAGQGPPRAGCTQCGGCMVGCRHNAKNTLDKNYLWLAERRGAAIVPETEVVDIRAIAGGYELTTVRSTRWLRRQRRTLVVRGVVLAGGVLGTVPLLLRCRQQVSLPKLSERIGTFVRTNTHALVGARTRHRDVDYSRGIAIASGFAADERTTVEMVRYGRGQDFMGLLSTALTSGGPPWPRPLRWLSALARHPLQALRMGLPFGFAQRGGIVLVVQSTPNHLVLRLGRRWWCPWRRRVTTDRTTSDPVPKFLPLANELATRVAEKIDGIPGSCLPEIFGYSTTAHILGGCPMGENEQEGAIDRHGRLFGYERLYVVDGSAVPVNLGVNPSLTITALAEWFMSHVPAAPDQ